MKNVKYTAEIIVFAIFTMLAIGCASGTGATGSSVSVSSSNSYLERGLTAAAREDYNHAIENYTQAIRLNPHNVAAYYNRGLTYYIIGDFSLAIADYEAVLRIEPNHSNAQRSLDRAMHEQVVKQTDDNED